MKSFSATVRIFGVNPYVPVPSKILSVLLKKAGKLASPLPVKGKLNGHRFTQTIVKYRGKQRLYLNTPMRKAAGIDVGDRANVEVDFDSRPRIVPMHPKFKRALAKNKKALTTFQRLPPHRKKEILRYINFLKTAKSVDRVVSRMLKQLVGVRTKGFNLVAPR
jgi:hypothetical protein